MGTHYLIGFLSTSLPIPIRCLEVSLRLFCDSFRTAVVIWFTFSSILSCFMVSSIVLTEVTAKDDILELAFFMFSSLLFDVVTISFVCDAKTPVSPLVSTAGLSFICSIVARAAFIFVPALFLRSVIF